MPIATTCPNCKAMFRLPEDLAGKTVKCQKCAQLFVVPEGNTETVAPGAVVTGADSAPPEPAQSTPISLPPPPSPKPPILARAVEKDDADEVDNGDEPPPLPDKRRPPTPRRRDVPAKSGSGMLGIILALVGLGVLCCVVCAGVGVGFVVLTPKAEIQKKPIRDLVMKDDKVKFDDGLKFDRPKLDGPKFDGPKFDDFKGVKDIKDVFVKDGFIKDGFVPPPPIVPPPFVNGLPVAFGPAGDFRSDNSLKVTDPIWRDRHYKLYNVRLEAGKTYQIDMMSKNLDSYLWLYDDAKTLVRFDDDGGGFPNARIFLIANRTGTYHLIATSFGIREIGEFTLTIRRN
jgi:predicted Zn finger-like uncharacterized protein